MILQANTVLKSTNLSTSLGESVGDRSKPLTSLSLRSLTQKAAQSKDPGNTTITALSLGSFPGVRSYSDSVGKADPDFYKLAISTLNTTRITFRNRSKSSIAVDLFDVLGNVVRQSGVVRTVRPGVSTGQVYTKLPAGTYFLRVKSSGEGNRYSLKAAVTATDPNQPPCGCGV